MSQGGDLLRRVGRPANRNYPGRGGRPRRANVIRGAHVQVPEPQEFLDVVEEQNANVDADLAFPLSQEQPEEPAINEVEVVQVEEEMVDQARQARSFHVIIGHYPLDEKEFVEDYFSHFPNIKELVLSWEQHRTPHDYHLHIYLQLTEPMTNMQLRRAIDENAFPHLQRLQEPGQPRLARSIHVQLLNTPSKIKNALVYVTKECRDPLILNVPIKKLDLLVKLETFTLDNPDFHASHHFVCANNRLIQYMERYHSDRRAQLDTDRDADLLFERRIDFDDKYAIIQDDNWLRRLYDWCRQLPGDVRLRAGLPPQTRNLYLYGPSGTGTRFIFPLFFTHSYIMSTNK